MLDIKKECPWCGREISKPNCYRGRCEHCHKLYRCISFEYIYSRLTRKQVGRREISGLGQIIRKVLILAVWGTLCIMAYWPGGSNLWLRIMVTASLAVSIYFLVVCKSPAFLKKAAEKGEEESEISGLPLYRKLFLAEKWESPFYHSPFYMELMESQTGRIQERIPVRLTMQSDLAITLDITDETPDALNHAGVEFCLYGETGVRLTKGIVLDLYTENTDVFQIQFEGLESEGTLSREGIYTARMQQPLGEEPFYLLVESKDGLESIKTGKQVYEVMLFHQTMLPREIPVPTKFSLYQCDGTQVGAGTLTYLFATRNLFESEKKVTY